MDKFSQLVEDLTTGRLTLNQIQIAIRASIRQRQDIPEGIKSILSGSSDRDAGLIYKMFKPIPEAIGCVELAYLRASQKEDS